MMIRPETTRDYAGITRVNARAFNDSPLVATIVDLHRHRPRFDADLSLVAEVDGRIVGHVLFSPQTIRLMGESLDVVNLSPLAVDPEQQRTGVGGALVTEGHRIAKAKGYPFSFLIGHPPYYPRFGYQTQAFGSSSVQVTTSDFAVGELETRATTEADVHALRDLWMHEEGGVDFAIDPGDEWIDWISPNPEIKAVVYLRGGEIAGYTRASAQKVHYFLARDAEAARQMARMLGEVVELPLHPYSTSSVALGTPQYGAWDAAMVCSFAPSAFEAYYAEVKAGKRIPGRPIWGVEFDLAE